MPRTAATILGLTLVAFSIGFNTVRYPVVWEMVNPARASELAQPAATSQTQESDSLTPPSTPAKPIEVQPTPDPAPKTTADSAAPAEGKPSGSDSAFADGETRTRLVPVTPLNLVGARADASASEGVRRLPPVAAGDADLANRDPARIFGGSIPVYPTTGIE